MNEIWIIKSVKTGNVLGAAPTLEAAKAMFAHPRTTAKNVRYERFVSAPVPEIPRGFVGNISMDSGLATFEDGRCVNLLKVQAVINGAFQEHGDQEYADAADDLSKLTGLVQGAYGDWEEAE